MLRMSMVSVVATAAGVLVAATAGRAGAQDARPPGARMPVRNGTITVKVDQYDVARQQVLDAARQQGAEVLDAKTEVDEKGKKHGWMRLRLSLDRLPRLVPSVHGVGKLYSENLSTAETVSQYEELERRVNRLREHEQRLDNLLRSSRRLRGSDILYIQERLFRAGVDASLLQQRRTDLERSARMCTITVALFEPEPVRAVDLARIDLGNRFAAARQRAGFAFNRQLARATTAGAYVLVFAPVWMPVLALALALLALLWRYRVVLLTRLTTAVSETAVRIARIAAARWPPAPPGPASP